MSFATAEQQQPFQGPTAQQAVKQNTVIGDFLNTRTKNLGDYPANHESRLEFNRNLDKIAHELIPVLNLFTYDQTGALVPTSQAGVLTATTHNDFYKFTMAPVIAWVEASIGKKVNVTFSVDIRDVGLADRLQRNHNGIVDDVILALHNLSNRNFSREIVLAAAEGKTIAPFWKENANNILGPVGAPRTLIRPYRPEGALSDDFHGATVIYNRPVQPSDVADGGVAIAVFERETSKGSINSAEPPRKLYIEATGPWGRSSFLETTMMQAVYQVALQHHLRELDESYGQWLYEALFRCHLSMTFAKEACPKMSGALFSGRRTGHHIFTLCQVLYHSRFYTGEGGGGKCIGTSSVDAWYTLSKVMNFPGIVPPVGTHAHELSMVFMSLFPELDSNPDRLPFSQALAHYMYYRLVHQGGPAPMPMLPDTLGSYAFLKAVASIWVYRMENGKPLTDQLPVRLLSLFTSARQDSGSLIDFKECIESYKSVGLASEKLGIMASEIDDKESLQRAHELGYVTYGTGGFMGDSEKAWPVTETKFSASMAVKAVRVWVDEKRCKCNPIKLGDAANTVKVTGDTLLPPGIYHAMVENAAQNREFVTASVKSGELVGTEEMLITTSDDYGYNVTMSVYPSPASF